MSHDSGMKACENKKWVFKSIKYSLSSESVSNNFKIFWQDGTLCDVDLVSGDTVVKAHSVILAAACVFFETMFKYGFEDCGKKNVPLPSISSEVLPLVVEFIYTGQTVICSSTVQHLLDAADMLQLEELTAGCVEYLKNHLRPENVLGVIRLAETHNVVQLADEAISYARDNWPAVAERDEIVDAPLTLLVQLLSSDHLVIDDEVQILRVALRWLDHDPASRKQHCMEIMQQVPLRMVSLQAFENALTSVRDPALMAILDVFKVVLSTVSNEPRLEPVVNEEAHLENQSCLYVVGGHKNYQSYSTAWKFDGNTWTQIASMNEPRHSLGVAAMGGLVYAVGGGIGRGDKLASAEVYDPRTDSWTAIASMRRPRCYFALAAVDNKLYAFGGTGESSIEVYDPAANQWAMAGDMPENRYGMTAVTYGGAVYIVGGQTPTSHPSNDVLRYAPEQAEWRRLRPILPGDDGRTYCAVAAVHGSNFYLVGGVGMGRKVGGYNLETEESYVAAETSVKRAYCVSGVLNGVLVVAGDDVNRTELYDLTTEEWSTGPSLPESRIFAGAAVL